MEVRQALLAEPLFTSPQVKIETLLPLLLADRDGTAAVLSEQGELLGLVGLTDVLRKIVPVYLDLNRNLAGIIHATYLEENLDRLQGIAVSEIMVSPATTVQLKESLLVAASKIVEHGRRVLPALEGRRFVSFISRSSVLAAVLHGRAAA
jgi:CBS-domain-containing membrane protein